MLADRSQQWERLVGLGRQETGPLGEELGQRASADALEVKVQQWVRGLGEKTMETLCQEVVLRKEQGEAPRCCGLSMDHHSRRGRTVVTLVGTVQVRRRYL